MKGFSNMSFDRKVKSNDKYVGFLGSEFSNFYKCNFKINGVNFDSSEQAFMYCKAKLFNDDEIGRLILKSNSAKECKRLGRKVSNFEEKKWNENKEKFMYIILKAKFSSNEFLRNKLLNTGDKIIVECAPFDKEWGIGINVDEMFNGVEWKGDNKLGNILMKVRDELKEVKYISDLLR